MIEGLTEKMLLEKTPQEITSILYKTCIQRLESAVKAIEIKDYEEANKLLQKCNDIVHRLGAGLKYEAGPIADQLDYLYNYIADELIKANINKDMNSIKVALKIVEEISEAWDIAMDKGIDNDKINKNVLKYEENLINTSVNSTDVFEYQK